MKAGVDCGQRIWREEPNSLRNADMLSQQTSCPASREVHTSEDAPSGLHRSSNEEGGCKGSSASAASEMAPSKETCDTGRSSTRSSPSFESSRFAILSDMVMNVSCSTSNGRGCYRTSRQGGRRVVVGRKGLVKRCSTKGTRRPLWTGSCVSLLRLHK